MDYGQARDQTAENQANAIFQRLGTRSANHFNVLSSAQRTHSAYESKMTLRIRTRCADRWTLMQLQLIVPDHL